MQAKDIMNKNVITVHTTATIAEIAKILVDNDISGVPVVDDKGSLAGIVSEGDLLHKETGPRLPDFINILGAVIYFNGVERFNEDFKKLMAGQASSIMTNKVIAVSEETEVDQIAKLMLQHGIKRIPVVRNGKIVGIISRKDIVRLLVH
jgi:CBS domain-containing protein